MEFTKSQLTALEHITGYARNHAEKAKKTINHILKMSNISEETFADAVNKIKDHARIGLHFHPDRPNSSMKSIAEALLEDGIYKSQFETGLSNGSVSAYSGGERDLWEKKCLAVPINLKGQPLTNVLNMVR